MAYEVNLNGATVETNSYAAACTEVKSAAWLAISRLAAPLRNGLYRSPKTTARINADRQRSATKANDAVKFPKTAGNVTGRVAGLNYAITRK